MKALCERHGWEFEWMTEARFLGHVVFEEMRGFELCIFEGFRAGKRMNNIVASKAPLIWHSQVHHRFSQESYEQHQCPFAT